MSTWGLQRIDSATSERKGLRLMLPVFVQHARRYDVNFDEFRTGWWTASFSVAIERYGSHGIGLRLDWGFIPAKSAKLDPDRSAVWDRLGIPQ